MGVPTEVTTCVAAREVQQPVDAPPFMTGMIKKTLFHSFLS